MVVQQDVVALRLIEGLRTWEAADIHGLEVFPILALIVCECLRWVSKGISRSGRSIGFGFVDCVTQEDKVVQILGCSSLAGSHRVATVRQCRR